MADFQAYLDKRGIGEEQMRDARKDRVEMRGPTFSFCVRRAAGMTQTEIVRIMGVSQKPRLEDGERRHCGNEHRIGSPVYRSK